LHFYMNTISPRCAAASSGGGEATSRAPATDGEQDGERTTHHPLLVMRLQNAGVLLRLRTVVIDGHHATRANLAFGEAARPSGVCCAE